MGRRELTPIQRRLLDKYFGRTPEERRENARDLVKSFGKIVPDSFDGVTFYPIEIEDR